MSARATFRKDDLDKALAVVTANGLKPRRVRIASDGAIDIYCDDQPSLGIDPVDLVDWKRK